MTLRRDQLILTIKIQRKFNKKKKKENTIRKNLAMNAEG